MFCTVLRFLKKSPSSLPKIQAVEKKSVDLASTLFSENNSTSPDVNKIKGSFATTVEGCT